MQITKYTLDRTHCSWGDVLAGTVTIKMGSNEQIRSSKGGGVSVWLELRVSVDGVLQPYETDPDIPSMSSGGVWPTAFTLYDSLEAEEDFVIARGATQTLNFSARLERQNGSDETNWAEVAAKYGVDLAGNDRLQPYFLLRVDAFELSTDVDSHSYYAIKEFQHTGGFLYERLAPRISNFKIIDKHPNNLFELFGGFVLGGQSKPAFTADVTPDPLDPTLNTTLNVELLDAIDGRWVKMAEASGELGAELELTLPMETTSHPDCPEGTGLWWCRCYAASEPPNSTDTKGAGIHEDLYVYNYAFLPRLSIPSGHALAERYSAVESDTGEISYVATDDGTSVRLSLGTEICRIAPYSFNADNPDLGQNEWYLDVSYGENGGDMTTKNVASGTDEKPINEYLEDMLLLEGVEFDPTKKYVVSITLRDKVGNSSMLTAYIDAAGAYLNVEKRGVAVGMRSTGTPENPIFECKYPAYFYGGVILGDAEMGGGGGGDYPAPGTELNTGGKWFNGKPIYRAIIETGAKTANTMKYDVSAFNIEHYISIQGMFYAQANYADGYVFPAPAAHMNNVNWTIQLEAENRTTLTTGATSRTWKSGWILIEYTKAD